MPSAVQFGAVGVEAAGEGLVVHLRVALDVLLDLERRNRSSLGHQERDQGQLADELLGVLGHVGRAYGRASGRPVRRCSHAAICDLVDLPTPDLRCRCFPVLKPCADEFAPSCVIGAPRPQCCSRLLLVPALATAADRQRKPRLSRSSSEGALDVRERARPPRAVPAAGPPSGACATAWAAAACVEVERATGAPRRVAKVWRQFLTGRRGGRARDVALGVSCASTAARSGSNQMSWMTSSRPARVPLAGGAQLTCGCARPIAACRPSKRR